MQLCTYNGELQHICILDALTLPEFSWRRSLQYH